MTLIGAAAAALIAGAGAGTAAAASAAVRLTPANASPYMIQSAGNLYWTDTSGDDALPSYS